MKWIIIIILVLVCLPSVTSFSIEHEMLRFETDKGYMNVYSYGDLVGQIGLSVQADNQLSLFTVDVSSDNYIWNWSKGITRNGTRFTGVNNNYLFNWVQVWDFDVNKSAKVTYYLQNNMAVDLQDTKISFTNLISEGKDLGNEVDFGEFTFIYDDLIENSFNVIDTSNGNNIVTIDLGDYMDGETIVLDPVVTSWKSPQTTGSPEDDWTNGANIISSNDVYATETTIGHNLSTGDYNFVIPKNSTIHGIECQLEAKGVGGVRFDTVRIDMALSYDGGSSLTAYKPQVWGLTETYKDYGGVSDTWGRAWTAEELNLVNFEARLKLGSLGGSMSSVSADHIRCRVNYTIQIPQLTFVPQTPDNDTIIGASLKLNITSDYPLVNAKVEHNSTGTWQNTTLDIYDSEYGCSGNLLGLTNGVNFLYRVYGDSGGDENVTEMRTNTVVNTMPELSLNLPLNGSSGSALFRLLNWSMNDTKGDMIEINIYASNSTSTMQESIIYRELIDTDTSSGVHTFNFTYPLTQYNNVYALYHLDNQSIYGENDTYIHDFSGNSINGTAYNTEVERYGRFGGSLGGFDLYDKIVLGNGTSFKDVCDNGCTFSAWIKPGDYVTGRAILARSKDVSNRFMEFYLKSTNEIVFFVGYDGTIGGGGCVAETVPYTDFDEWHNVMGVFNETDTLIYIDGVLNTSTTCTFTGINETMWDNDAEMWIGNRDYAEMTFYGGSIDEVAFLSKGLNSSDVKDLWTLKMDNTYYWNVTATDFTLTNNSETWQFTYGEEAPTCVYSSGDWSESGTNNCVIEENVIMDGGSFILIDVGTFTLASGYNITNWSDMDIKDTLLILQNGSGMWSGM